ncbi:hypothetical protein ACHAWT_008298 [Skeletonema menzelii]
MSSNSAAAGPKRNQSAFFWYSNATRADIKAAQPDLGYAEVAKLISINFKALPDEERAYWDEKAAADKERYQREMAAYRGDIIRDEYLQNFHRTCCPSKEEDTEDRSLSGQLQRMNMNCNSNSNSNSNSSPQDLLDVPIVTMKHVASFLSGPSRALFAVALNNNLSRRECRAIAGNQWRTLDFGQIEKSLAEKLTDNDISDVLLCIDSVRTVRKLRLANCINLTGVGLEPLRGSRVMEHIDLSLVPDHTSPLLDPEPPLSQELVIPILSTIVGTKLKMMEFPKAWRQNNERDFEAFDNAAEFDAFNQLLELFELNNMEQVCGECEGEIEPNFSNEAEGTQRYTCYRCYRNYCEDCIMEYDSILFCDKCERHYCSDCMEFTCCETCNSFYCEECEPLIDCEECDLNLCSSCIVKTSCKQCSKEIQQCCSCSAHYNSETNKFSSEGTRKCFYCLQSGDTYCNDCASSVLTSCDGCRSDHCGRCAAREGLHICSDYEFCDFENDGCFCKHCRVGTTSFPGYGFGCKVCYERYCPTLLKEYERLREEIMILKMKLQEAEDGLAPADIDIVMSQAGCSRARARKALKAHDNNVVEAIMSLV